VSEIRAARVYSALAASAAERDMPVVMAATYGVTCARRRHRRAQICSRLALAVEEVVGPDLTQPGDDRRLVAAVADVLLDRLNASSSASGVCPSPLSVEARWTNVTPSSSWSVA
jgi:hypothetical protein